MGRQWDRGYGQGKWPAHAGLDVARELGVGEGFRLVVNNGESVGMTIYHLHLHVIGGRTYAEQDMTQQNTG